MRARATLSEKLRQYVRLVVILLVGMRSSGSDACPIEDEAGGDAERAFAAGCLIREHGKLLVIRHRSSGKLGIPAGLSAAKEPSRCTAYRETLEETGVDVKVHELLMEFDGGFRLYRCRPSGPVDTSLPVAVPASGVNEVSAVIWIDPTSWPSHHWRFPAQHADLITLFDAIGPD